MSMVLPSQAYTLQLKPQSFPVSVLRFSGKASVSELYEYQIDFTSPVADIPMDQVVGRPATFTIDPVDPDQGYLQRMFGERWKDFSKMPKSYVTHGMICRFEQLGMSADETRYRVVLVPGSRISPAPAKAGCSRCNPSWKSSPIHCATTAIALAWISIL